MNDAERRNLMTRYLMGQTSPEEREELEKEYASNDDLFEELVATENDLIDAFVRGDLSGTEREQFAMHFLTHPRRQERVEFARVVADYRREGIGQRVESGPALWKPSPALGFGNSLARAAAAVAILIVISLGGTMAIMSYRLRKQVAVLQHHEKSLQQEVAVLTARLQQANANTSNKRATTELPLPGTATVSLMLSPGLVRGNSQANLLPFPPGVARARLLLKREHEDYASYTVALETVGGSPLLRQAGLTGQPAGNSTKVITVELTSSVLRRGDYVLRLFATRSGKLDEIEDYSFRILRR